MLTGEVVTNVEPGEIHPYCMTSWLLALLYQPNLAQLNPGPHPHPLLTMV